MRSQSTRTVINKPQVIAEGKSTNLRKRETLWDSVQHASLVRPAILGLLRRLFSESEARARAHVLNYTKHCHFT